MLRLPHVRQIIDPAPNSGAWNMMVDEALLNSAIRSDVATLRWYTWREPTVSLGYFQNEAEIVADGRLEKLPRVKRLSGGGALVHDRELTYSLTLPASQRLIQSPVELYRVVHQAIVGVLRQRGLDVRMRGRGNPPQNDLASVTPSGKGRRDEPVLCFVRQDEHDLVITDRTQCDRKVLGSAQRRRRGAILQHGGLLLQASAITPELPGLVDLFPGVDLTDLAPALGQAILREISDEWTNLTLSSADVELSISAT